MRIDKRNDSTLTVGIDLHQASVAMAPAHLYIDHAEGNKNAARLVVGPSEHRAPSGSSAMGMWTGQSPTDRQTARQITTARGSCFVGTISYVAEVEGTDPKHLLLRRLPLYVMIASGWLLEPMGMPAAL